MHGVMNAAAAAAARAHAHAVAAAPPPPPPALVPMSPFPGFPQDARLPPPLPFTGFMFTQEDVDMILYGYARNKVNEQLPGHALSGLRVSELSHGKS